MQVTSTQKWYAVHAVMGFFSGLSPYSIVPKLYDSNTILADALQMCGGDRDFPFGAIGSGGVVDANDEFKDFILS